MKAKTKTILIIAGIIAAVITAWYFIKKRKAAKAIETSHQGENPKGIGPTPKEEKPADQGSVWPLNKGSKNQYVKALQAWLNEKHKAGLVTDGILGNKTYAALVRAKIFTPISLEQFNKIFGK